MRTSVWGLGAALLLLAEPVSAQSQQAVIRVVDVGPGLCVVASIPGGHDLVYDGGHWTSSTCRAAANELVTDRIIDLLVISHPDADHLGEIPELLEDHRAARIIHTGHEGTSNTWRQAMAAIRNEREDDDATVTSLESQAIAPGTTFPLGPATLTFIAGWHEWDEDPSEGDLSEAELRNVISIVMRLDYRGRSILLTGDTIGRNIGSADSTCDHAENWMTHPSRVSRLRADILIAPHHGADNGSSTCFIQAVAPRWVIFSAGHDHEHPRAAAAERYERLRPQARLMRTDYGDDEGGREWTRGRRPGCRDGVGDDDIEIRIRSTGSSTPRVRYRSARSSCS